MKDLHLNSIWLIGYRSNVGITNYILNAPTLVGACVPKLGTPVDGLGWGGPPSPPKQITYNQQNRKICMEYFSLPGSCKNLFFSFLPKDLNHHK